MSNPSIEVKLLFPDQASLLAFFAGKGTPPAAAPAVVAAAPKPPAPPASAAVTTEKQDAARASTAKAPAPPASPITGTPAAVAGTPAAVANTTANAVDYPTLQKAVFDLVGKVKAAGQDPDQEVLGIARALGYENFKAMKDAGPAGATKFAEALTAVQAKAAALTAEPAVA